MRSKCFKTIGEICEALGENIDSELCQEIKNHLDSCPKCCAQVDSLRNTVHLFQCIKNVEVPASVDSRLWKVLHLNKP